MKKTYNILVTRRIPNAALKILKERCNVDLWDSDDVIPHKTLLDKVQGKDGVLCLLTDKINKDLLENAGENLKVVSTLSVGVDHIDLGECKQHGIRVGYTPNILTSATAELTVALLLATSRRIVEGVKAVKDGEWASWKPLWMCGPTLQGSTVGLFGLGRIGQAVVDRLRPFGVSRFIYNTLNKKTEDFDKKMGGCWVGFEDLLRESDFLISCCALTPATTNVFNKDAFKKMKSSSVFINIARGAVVEQDALYGALQSKRIRAAGLDVTTPEPLSPTNPLLLLDNCVITPHIGSAAEPTRANMAVLAAENLINGLDDVPMEAQYDV